MGHLRVIENTAIRGAWLGTFVLVWTFLPRAALAQWNEATPTAQERAKQYDELAAEAEHLQGFTNVLRKVVHLVKPTVVHIDSVHKDSSGHYGRHSEEDAGSGTIFQDGDKFYVLTNRHVVKDSTSDNITIKLADGRELHPSRILADPKTDIAVMAVQGSSLVATRIGNSNDVEVGDFVLAIGSPFGLSHSVTFGIISAKGRRDLEFEGEPVVPFQDYFQTDAAINPGNSGGPLVNLKGEVIGINSAIATGTNSISSAGVGFTIPIDMAMFVAKQLIEHGTVDRAYLGVRFYDKEKDKDKFSAAEFIKIGLPHPEGARLAGVVTKSPAEAAKLQRDDVIVEFNGVPVEDDSHLMFLVSEVEVGKDVPIIVFRDGKTIQLTVKVGDRAAYPE
jgi:serine protease Do